MSRNEEFEAAYNHVRTLPHIEHWQDVEQHLREEHGFGDVADPRSRYVKSLHHDSHLNDEMPLDRNALGISFVVPRGFYGEATHVHEPRPKKPRKPRPA